jgi:DNA-directed RNA polymerase I and III subunit RPAC1
MAISSPSPQGRNIVGVNKNTVTDVSSTDFPGHFFKEDHAWDKDRFNQTFSVQFHHNEKYDSSFSLIGIDASIANAFRRCLLAEIPTLAIEYVYVQNNTSIIQDEVLAQRLGLIPLRVDSVGLTNYLRWYKKFDTDAPQEERASAAFDYNTIILHLKIECTRNESAARGELDPRKKYHNAHVYAKDIEFKPFGAQLDFFGGDKAIVPTNPDILIAKLRPGQCIDIEMHAILGVGSDHAKYSPVSTASYRLLPTIIITKPILGKDAEKFQKCFPQGVITLKTVTTEEAMMEGSGYEGHEGETMAIVEDPMKDTVSRECLRHEEFEEKVKLGRVRDHFIFSIESVGQRESDEMFLMATALMKEKCRRLRGNLRNMAA